MHERRGGRLEVRDDCCRSRLLSSLDNLLTERVHGKASQPEGANAEWDADDRVAQEHAGDVVRGRNPETCQDEPKVFPIVLAAPAPGRLTLNPSIRTPTNKSFLCRSLIPNWRSAKVMGWGGPSSHAIGDLLNRPALRGCRQTSV